jgi:hypothetical protein
MASVNNSALSVRLHLRSVAAASTSVKDSTSAMIGFLTRPRPWALELRAPPSVRRSAPVCFWRDGPLLGAAGLGGLEIVDQRGPLDAGTDLDQAALLVEVDDAVHAAHVDQHALAQELLAAHGVASAGDAQAEAALPGVAHDLLQSLDGGRPHAGAQMGGIQLAVNVVHPQTRILLLGALFHRRAGARQQVSCRQNPRPFGEGPPRQHVVLPLLRNVATV